MNGISPHNQSGLREKVISSVLWLTILQYTGQVISWGITLYVIKLLNPEDYGLMAKAYISIGFMVMLSELGLSAALIQKSNLRDRQVSDALGFVILSNLAFTVLLFCGAQFLADFFGDNRLVPVFRYLSSVFIFISIYIVPQSIMMRQMQYRLKSAINLSATVAASSVTLILAFHQFGVFSLVWGQIFFHIVNAIGFNLKNRSFVKPSFRFGELMSLIYFGGYISGSRLLWYLYSNIDQIIGGKYFKSAELGIYSIALTLATLPLDKIAPIVNQVAFSAYSIIQSDPDLMRRQYLKTVRMASLFAFPVFWGMVLVIPEFMALFGEKWAGAVVPIQILCLILPFRAISTLFAPILQGSGKPKREFSNLVIVNAIMIPSFLIGIRWGIAGLCSAWVVGYAVSFTIICNRSLKAIGIGARDFLSAILTPMMAASIMTGAIFMIKNNFLQLQPLSVSIVCVILLGAVTYAAVVYTINQEIVREIRVLLKFAFAGRS